MILRRTVKYIELFKCNMLCTCAIKRLDSNVRISLNLNLNTDIAIVVVVAGWVRFGIKFPFFGDFLSEIENGYDDLFCFEVSSPRVGRLERAWTS